MARICLLSIILFSTGVVAHAGLTYQAPSHATADVATQSLATDSPQGLIAVTGQYSPNTHGSLAVFSESKELVYFEQDYHIYFDVDPVPGEPWNVTIVTANLRNNSECPTGNGCVRNFLVKINLRTGESWELYRQDYKGQIWNGWHDADHVGGDDYLVADILHDRLFIVNTSTDLVQWEWNAQTQYPVDGGRDYLGDWTHLNDMEYHNGTVIASIRNFDQVVFIDRETGLVEAKTLGEDDNHTILYEQHNPDYIPAANGGPALVVGDSENDRVVEYQYENGHWRQAWIWQDERMSWPRDADRLPTGETLITDSHGDRVLIVNKEGDIRWQIEYALPYEAEYLDTPDESGGGPAAVAANLASKQVATREEAGESQANLSLRTSFDLFVRNAIPPRIRHAIDFVLPVWINATEAGLLVLAVAAVVGWGLLELRWSPYRLSVRTPFVVDR